MKFKTVLWLLGGAFVLLAGGGMMWWRKHGPEIMQKAKLAIDEGQALGLRADGLQCMDSTLSQLDPKEPKLGSTVRLGLFFRSCAEKSSGLPAICARDTSSGVMGRMRWIRQLCTERGISNPTCPSVLNPLVELCLRKHL